LRRRPIRGEEENRPHPGVRPKVQEDMDNLKSRHKGLKGEKGGTNSMNCLVRDRETARTALKAIVRGAAKM